MKLKTNEEQFVINTDSTIYEVSNLSINDGVRNFLEDTLPTTTRAEIAEQKEEILDNYVGKNGELKYKTDGYEVIFDYENDATYSNLEFLESELDNAITINLNDETYNKIYKIAQEYGYLK